MCLLNEKILFARPKRLVQVRQWINKYIAKLGTKGSLVIFQAELKQNFKFNVPIDNNSFILDLNGNPVNRLTFLSNLEVRVE